MVCNIHIRTETYLSGPDGIGTLSVGNSDGDSTIEKVAASQALSGVSKAHADAHVRYFEERGSSVVYR